MDNFRIKQTFWGIGSFILLNFFSMIFYPGGTLIDKDTDGYLFFYNFLTYEYRVILRFNGNPDIGDVLRYR